jgi:hypothetical protein
MLHRNKRWQFLAIVFQDVNRVAAKILEGDPG